MSLKGPLSEEIKDSGIKDFESLMDKDVKYDLSFLYRVSEGDLELKHKIIKVFLNSYPQKLKEIMIAINNENYKLLKESAHSLKGAVSNFGAETIHNMAYELELMGKNCEITKAFETFEELKKELFALEEVLLKEINWTTLIKEGIYNW